MTTLNLTEALENLRKRMAAHPTQKIADAAGLTVPTVRAVRKGVNVNPTITTVQRIHDAVGRLDIIKAAEDLK